MHLASRHIWLLPGLLLHALGMAVFINWHDVVHNPPIHFSDYSLHYAGVAAARHFFVQGHLWGYDPYFHAGYPGGTLFDVDNKGIEIASMLLHSLGLSLPHSFNAVVLSLIALAPLSIYASARMLGLRRPAAGLALLLTLLLWYTDPTLRWNWQGGTLAYVSTAFGSVFVVAAFLRWAFPDSAKARTISLAWWFALGPLLFWLHPWAFFVLLVPLVVGTLQFEQQHQGLSRLIPFAWVGWVLLITAPLLGLILRFLSDRTSSAQFLQGGLLQLLADLGAAYGLMRIGVIALAVLGLLHWREANDKKWIAIAAAIGWLLVLAYGAVHVGEIGGNLQPYRFIVPALAFATLPAADWVLTRTQRWRCTLLVVLVLSGGVLLWNAHPTRFMPPEEAQKLLSADGTRADYLSGPRASEHAVCASLQKHDLQSGRVLTNDWRLGAFLPECSAAQVIGGPFLWVWTVYGHSNAGPDELFGIPIADYSADEMASALADYNVGWIVVNRAILPEAYTLSEWIRDHAEAATFRAIARHGVFDLYEAAGPSNWFFEGSGEVQADYDRILVRNADSARSVLKYHWIDSLRVEPPLRIFPVLVGADTVPFIGVANGTVREFVIVNDR